MSSKSHQVEAFMLFPQRYQFLLLSQCILLILLVASDNFATHVQAQGEENQIAYIGSDGNVWLIQADNSNNVQLTQDGNYRLPQWSSDGRFLAVVRTASGQFPYLEQEIWVIDMNDLSKNRIVNFKGTMGNYPLGISNLDWVEDNNSILFSVIYTRSPDYSFYKVSVTNEVTINFEYGSDDCTCRVEDPNLQLGDIDYFRVGDGQIIGSILDKDASIVLGNDVKWDLFSSQIDLSSLQYLQTGCEGDERHPSISPVQQAIAYTCDKVSLHVLDLSTMNDDIIYSSPESPPNNFEDPALLHTDWSANGEMIVFSFQSTYFSSQALPEGDIWIVNKNGSDSRFLTHGSSPTWQPKPITCGIWSWNNSGNEKDTRIMGVKIVNGEAISGCKSVASLSNNTAFKISFPSIIHPFGEKLTPPAISGGQYTLLLTAQNSGTEYVWTSLKHDFIYDTLYDFIAQDIENSTFLTPSTERKIEIKPEAPWSSGTVTVYGHVSPATLGVDTTITIVKEISDLLFKDYGCFVPQDELVGIAMQNIDILIPSMRYAQQLKVGEFWGEFRPAVKIFLYAIMEDMEVIPSLQEVFQDCTIETIIELITNSIAPAPKLIGAIVVKSGAFTIKASYDYLYSFERNPDQIELNYTP